MLESVNLMLDIATIGAQIAVFVLFALMVGRRFMPELDVSLALIRRHALLLAFLVALGASAMTLVHQYVFNLPPCPLCWWQRVFLYPQVILFGVALVRKDVTPVIASLALSLLGLVVALYHHALQLFPAGSLPCPADGEISCAQILFLQFGYITYPMMGATVFALLIALMLLVRRS